MDGRAMRLRFRRHTTTGAPRPGDSAASHAPWLPARPRPCSSRGRRRATPASATAGSSSAPTTAAPLARSSAPGAPAPPPRRARAGPAPRPGRGRARAVLGAGVAAFRGLIAVGGPDARRGRRSQSEGMHETLKEQLAVEVHDLVKVYGAGAAEVRAL